MLFFRKKSPRRKNHKEAGITLTEVLVTIFIIGLISGAAVLAVRGPLENARSTRVQNDLSTFSNALELYSLSIGTYPTQSQGLQALVEKPSDIANGAAYPTGGFLGKDTLPMDPWGRPYIYEVPATRSRQPYDLYSLGADGQEGGEGPDADIGNWSS